MQARAPPNSRSSPVNQALPLGFHAGFLRAAGFVLLASDSDPQGASRCWPCSGAASRVVTSGLPGEFRAPRCCLRHSAGRPSGRTSRRPPACYAREELEKRCVENGLDPDDVLLSLRESPYITQLLAIAEDAREEGQPHTWRCRLRQEAGAPPLPDWWAVSGGPLVYLTFGTVAPTIGFYPQLYLDVLSGLADLKARVLVTVGRSVDPAVLGALPAPVRVERWVEQERVMPYTTAMIGHCGFGTTLKVLTSAVPQVVIPLFADPSTGRLSAKSWLSRSAAPWTPISAYTSSRSSSNRRFARCRPRSTHATASASSQIALRCRAPTRSNKAQPPYACERS